MHGIRYSGDGASLDAGALLAWAERDSGGYGLADAKLQQRLGEMVAWIEARGPYRADQVEGMARQIQRMLVNRLLIALDRERYPGIAAETIERPVFIIGFARSGTTFLQSLLAEDPAVLTLQSWNVLSPSPPPGAGPVASSRFAFAQRAMDAWTDLCPGQRAMHPYIDKGAYQLCEDEELLSLDFRYAYPYYFWKVPTLEGMILAHEQREAFAFHRQILQHFQWNTGRTRWVCKSPAAQHHLDAIFDVYPDARCIWAHRPMSEMFASIVSLNAVVFDAIGGGAREHADWARTFALSMKAAFDRLLANDLIADPRIHHLDFRSLSRAPIETVAAIGEWLGEPVSDAFARNAAAWLADPENQIDRHGRYPYSYERIGIDPAWIDELFADYSQRFGL